LNANKRAGWLKAREREERGGGGEGGERRRRHLRLRKPADSLII
jgi:hypothetical protein